MGGWRKFQGRLKIFIHKGGAGLFEMFIREAGGKRQKARGKTHENDIKEAVQTSVAFPSLKYWRTNKTKYA